MKNDIKEKILRYLEQRMISSAIPSNSRKVIAKEIFALFKDYYSKEFVELIDVDIIRTESGLYYFKKTAGMPDMTLSEIYKLWQNLPENKK